MTIRKQNLAFPHVTEAQISVESHKKDIAKQRKPRSDAEERGV